MKPGFNHTIRASYLGFVTQAIINNFAPLLFLTFQSSFSITLDRLTILVTANFLTQLAADAFFAKFAVKIGYKRSIVMAHIFAAAGLIGLAVFPAIFGDPFIGLLAAVMLYAVGGGIIEVLISPIVEACPTTEKSASMSFLHSFYCWGQVSVIVLSTVFFLIFGTDSWRYLAFFWALIPLANAIYFSKVPILTLEELHGGQTFKTLFKTKIFWLFVLLMIASGAAEQAMSQWASAFAEAELGVRKAVGDLLGPGVFAVLMGTSRALYSKFNNKVKLGQIMTFSGILGIACFLLASLSPMPGLALAGVALCGLAVGVLWPGTLSLAAAKNPSGGTAMFGLLALSGDIGCALGPFTVGIVSDIAGNMRMGVLAGVVFPAMLVLAIVLYRKRAAA